jgi:flagellin-like protein
MRGISPVIATVIILAVTIAIAVAVIGWITGLFGATTSGTEQLQIYPDSYIKVKEFNNTNDILHLHVINKGNDLTIYKIVTCKEEITSFTYSLNSTSPDHNLNKSDNEIVIEAGFDGWLNVKLNKHYTVGTSCEIKIYTKAGNVFTAIVNVQK